MGITKLLLKANYKINSYKDKKRIKSQVSDSGLVEILDIPYIDDKLDEHLLDIYYPDNTCSKFPVIIDIHGGGWMSGSKEVNKNFCLRVSKKGFLVVSLNYRLAGKFLFNEQIEDILSALNWVSSNIQNYPADINNIYLMGDSAGGHFAGVINAVSVNENLQSDFTTKLNKIKFNAVAQISPVIDLISKKFILNINLPVLLSKNFRQSKYIKYMDYKNIISPNIAPVYIATSDGDFLKEQSYALHSILSANKIEHKLDNYTNKENGNALPHVFAVLDPYTDDAAKMIEQMINFFNQYKNGGTDNDKTYEC